MPRPTCNPLVFSSDSDSVVRNFKALHDFVQKTCEFWPILNGLELKGSQTTLSSLSGATATASSFIPDGALVLGVTSRIVTALGTGNGTTGYQVGDSVDADRWGNITGTAVDTISEGDDFVSGTVQYFTAAENVVVTAVGGNFDGTGDILLKLHYIEIKEFKI